MQRRHRATCHIGWNNDQHEEKIQDRYNQFDISDLNIENAQFG